MMRHRERHTAVASAIAVWLLLAACSSAAAPAMPDAEPERARAAIAILVVDNRSLHDLEILYRLTTTGARDVIVGRVPARTVAATAPVPAAEPVVLVARTRTLQLALEPRALDIGGSWTWVIPAGASFLPRPDTTS